MKFTPLHDVLLVELEAPHPLSTTIIVTTPPKVQTGLLRSVGPEGRKEGLEEGMRIAFSPANLEHKVGRAIGEFFDRNTDDKLALLRVRDVFFVVLDPNTKVT